MANQPRTAAPAGPLKIGDTLVKWEIRGPLGQGGHAWVYHGYDPFLDRHVAIKIIPSPCQAEAVRDLRQRAQREARVLSKLENENVVRLIEAGFTGDGAVYIVMEMLRGRTWRDALHAVGRFEVVEALALGAKVANGVEAAHGVHVIHRDLKPENVFVIERNGIKVLDFGIAKLFGPGAATTQRDLLHGTMKYMSPEHLQGLGVTRRSDIYALGTMLYEALCGCIPCMLGIQEPNANALIYAQLNRMPPLLDELVPSVPRFVARAIHRMIAKDPEDRFATMAEVAEVLRGNLQRYLRESNCVSPALRELWQVAPAVSPAVSGASSAHVTTEVHALWDRSPPTAPPVSLPTPHGHDTAPLSRPPFSEPGAGARFGVTAQPALSEPFYVVAPAPRLPAAAPAAPSLQPRPNASPPPMTPNAETRAPLGQIALRAPPSAPRTSPVAHSRLARATPDSDHSFAVALQRAHRSARLAWMSSQSQRTRPQPERAVSLLRVGIPLGAAIGVLVGFVSYWHPRATTSSAEEPIAAQPPQHAEPAAAEPRERYVAATATAPATPAASTAPPAYSSPAAALAVGQQAAPLSAPKLSTESALPLVGPARVLHVAVKPRPKPKAASTAPQGELWDRSELDTPAAQPEPAAPTPAATRPRPTVIYGGDEIAH